MPGVKAVDTYVRHMGGAPGDYRVIGDDIEIRGVMVSNDSPNTVYVVAGWSTNIQPYLLKVLARQGKQIPLPALRQLTVVADPNGIAVAAADEVTIVASPDPVPGSAWSTTGQTVALSGPGTAANNPLYEQLVGPGAAANNPVFSQTVGPTPGQAAILANNVPVIANGTVDTGAIQLFRTATVFVTVSGASNITTFLRSAAGLWYPAAPAWAAAAAGSNTIAVNSPGTGIRIQSSAAINWTVEYQTAQ